MPWRKYYASSDAPPSASPLSVPERLEEAVASFKGAIALEIGGKETSYTQLGKCVRSFAQGLYDHGVRAGDRVAIVLPMGVEAVVAFHAVLRLGAIAVQHSAHSPMAQLSRYFEDYEPVAAIVDENRVDAFAGMATKAEPQVLVSVPRVEAPREVKRLTVSALMRDIAMAGGRTIARTAVHATASPAPSLSMNSVRFKDLLSSTPISDSHPFPQPTDLATIVYGPYGPASRRGAMLTHGNLTALAAQTLTWLEDSTPGTEVAYAMWPLYSVTGLADTLTTGLFHGRRNVLFSRFDRGAIMKAMKKHPPTVISADPEVFQFLADLARSGKVKVEPVKFAFTRMDQLRHDAPATWTEVLGHPVVAGYGTAEACVISGFPLRADGHSESVGVPFPATDMKVVDPGNRGRILGPGEVGRLMIRGPQVFHGYWRQPDETSAVLSADGWMLTSERASIDNEGFVTLYA